MVVTDQRWLGDRKDKDYLLEKVAIGEVLSAHAFIEKDPDGDLCAFGREQSWLFVFVAGTATTSRLS